MIIQLFFLLLIGWSPPDTTIVWLTQKEVNVGIIEQNKAFQVAFSFKNTSDFPIVIDNVRTTCGCTVPSWPKEPIRLGDTATVTVEYDAQKKGDFRKKIKVYVSTQRRAEILIISGVVK